MNVQGGKIGAFFGIVFVVLLFTGLSLIDTQTQVLGLALIRVSMVAFLVYLGSLWRILSQVEGERPWLSQVTFGSGLMFVAIILTQDSASIESLGSRAAANSWITIALLMLTSGVIMIKSRVMPAWFGWAGVILAFPVWAPRMMGSDFVLVASVLFGLWVIAASVVILRHSPVG